MPYFATCYNTTVGKIFDLKKLDHALREALIAGPLGTTTFGVEPVGKQSSVFLIGGHPEQEQIQPFVHPYLIQNFKGSDYLVTDLRMFRNVKELYCSENAFELAVRNKTEYSLVKSRAVLSHLWLDSAQLIRFRSRFTFAGTVFASWLSQTIARTYALDFQDQMRMVAVGIYYYHCLFTENAFLEGDSLETAVIHTIKVTKIPATDIYAMFEKLGDISGIESYCNEVKNVVENIRLKDFNLAMLLTLIRNSWYGNNAKDLLSVALEHPPTWITIVYATLTERTYKSSQLYKIIELHGKRGAADEFRMNFNDLWREKVAVLVGESVEEEIVFKEFED